MHERRRAAAWTPRDVETTAELEEEGTVWSWPSTPAAIWHVDGEEKYQTTSVTVMSTLGRGDGNWGMDEVAHSRMSAESRRTARLIPPNIATNLADRLPSRRRPVHPDPVCSSAKAMPDR